MPKLDTFYRYRYNPDYVIYIHALFHTNEHGLFYMSYEDMDGEIFSEEVVDFDHHWRVTNGH